MLHQPVCFIRTSERSINDCGHRDYILYTINCELILYIIIMMNSESRVEYFSEII